MGAGGALGAVLRWGLELAVPTTAGWPWGTLLVNVLGCAAMAGLLLVGEHRSYPAWVRPGLGTGLLGGFTTFSTYAVQVAVLGTAGPLLAAGYLVLTPVLCVGAVVAVGLLARPGAGEL